MSNVRGIEPDMIAAGGARAKAQGSAATKTNFYDTMSQLTSYAGPAAAVATAQYASPKAAAVVGASIQASPGSMGGSMYGGNFGYNMTTPGATVTGSIGGGPIMPPGTNMENQAQNMMGQMQESSMKMLWMQEQIGSQNRNFTTLSNVMAAKEQLTSNILRNLRAA